MNGAFWVPVLYLPLAAAALMVCVRRAKPAPAPYPGEDKKR